MIIICVPVFAYAEISIHFLDVGQGDAAVILCDGEAMLIDGGNRNSSRLIYAYLTDTLKISHLKYIVCTHPHADHAGGLAAALNACTVDTVFSPLGYYDDPGFTAFRKQLLAHNRCFTMPLPGNTVRHGGAELLFLAPARLHANMNDNSIIVKILYGNTSFLFTGDAEQEKEQELIDAGFDIQATVLKVGHHGGETSSTWAFLASVQPEYAVISCGADNPYGHPSAQVLSALEIFGAEVLRTDLYGTIICRSDGITLAWEKERNSITRMTLPVPEEDQSEETIYIGNVNSHKLHKASCVGVQDMKEENKVYFNSREDAISLGYSPCRICNP